MFVFFIAYAEKHVGVYINDTYFLLALLDFSEVEPSFSFLI